MNLSKNVEIKASTATRICTNTTLHHCAVDVSGADGVLFIAVGSSHTTAKTTEAFLHLQGSSYSSAGWTNIGSTKLISSTKFATGQTEKLRVIDCYRPTRKWIRVAHHHTTGDLTVIGIKYNLRRGGSTDAWEGVGKSIGVGCYALSMSAT